MNHITFINYGRTSNDNDYDKCLCRRERLSNVLKTCLYEICEMKIYIKSFLNIVNILEKKMEENVDKSGIEFVSNSK